MTPRDPFLEGTLWDKILAADSLPGAFVHSRKTSFRKSDKCHKTSQDVLSPFQLVEHLSPTLSSELESLPNLHGHV